MALAEALTTFTEETKSILASGECGIGSTVGGSVRPRTKQTAKGLSLPESAIGRRTCGRS